MKRGSNEITYVRSYEPLKYKLQQIETIYGSSSQYVRQCRQLQVALTRVPKGAKTCVIELDAGGMYYNRINFHCMSGIAWNHFCALYESYSNLKKVEYGFKYALRYRGKVCTEVTEEPIHFFVPRLEFPTQRLMAPPGIVIDDILQNWFSDNKRKRES